MENDFFSEINNHLRALPEEIHLITWGIMMVLYAQLMYGAFIERHKLKPHVRVYFIIRGFLMVSYLMIKAIDTRYGMFDLFLFAYILLYIDGLIILKGFTFHRCDGFRQSVRRLTKFTSKRDR